MPIYEYKCLKCGERFEVNQRMSDKPLKKHANDAKCGGKVEKQMSANTFHLKGTGWYKTDYAKPSQSGGSGGSGDNKAKEVSPEAAGSKNEPATATPKKETTTTTTTAAAKD
jgi:putative FmdB family regulatory protein